MKYFIKNANSLMNGGMSNERVTTNAYQNNASYYG